VNLSRVAIKQLTASDLSFFAQHLRRSKQKAVNLNSDVFVDVFYPGLRGRYDEFPIKPFSIIGPGGKPPYLLTRKALRTPGSKNWRLDGEIVHDPPDEPGRFDHLQEDDLGILAFEGVNQPEVATFVLVSATEDAALHAALSRTVTFAGKQSMVIVSQSQLDQVLAETRTSYRDHHPVETLLLPDSVEEAIFGSADTQRRVAQTDGRGVAVSQDVMRQQLRAAEQVGQLGEEIYNQWLESTGHGEDDYEWVARTHARATHDFDIRRPRWQGASGAVFVDVKATRGALESPIHMSMAEIRWAAMHANHRIARVHGLGSDTASLTMLTGIHELAQTIMATAVPALPPGVSADGFEIDTTKLTTEFTVDVRTPED
jgi:hypothetical protein